MLDAYRDGQASILEESFAYRYYNADDVLIASVEDVDGTSVITVARNGVYLKAGDKVIQTADPTGETSYVYVYADSGKQLSDEAAQELDDLYQTTARAVPSYSRSFFCESKIGEADVTFDSKEDMFSEILLDPEAPNGITEGVVTLRHSVALSGYDGLSSYVLYGQMTYPDTMTVVIEVDGTAYSLAQKDDTLGLYGLIGSMMG